MELKVHSFESFGTVDGPGIRFVVFLKGCPLRCKFCHNPDTWDISKGKKHRVDELTGQIMRYKSYFSNGGGVTVSGGEPLLQPEAVTELFEKLKAKGIHTCIDTSGCTFNEKDTEKLDKLLLFTDLVLLDIKHMDSQKHEWLTGSGNENILAFARYLSAKGKKIWIRHVLIPGVTDSEAHLKELAAFISTLNTVEKTELLPYHTMGEVKYEKLGLEYPLKGYRTPTKEEVYNAKKILGIIK